MDKKELIEKLRENARLNLDSPYEYNRGRGDGYENACLLAERLEPDKVELTQEQADAVERYKNNPIFSLTNLLNDYWTKSEELLARAYLDGYTIKKEPKYLVRLAPWDDEGYLNTYVGGSFPNHYTMGSIKPETGYKFEFTEAEIKTIDERYWAFAEKVEETK